MKNLAFIAAGLSAAFAFAAPAAARDDEPRMVVDVSDLDRQADADEIERRVARAARRVCGMAAANTFAANAEVRTCRTAAVERALGR
jgi:UrcA family protein